MLWDNHCVSRIIDLVIKLVVFNLTLSGAVKYRRTELDFQSPNILISSMGIPDSKAKEAPLCERCDQHKRMENIPTWINIRAV